MTISERRITRENAENELIMFRPKTPAEAEALQKKLFSLGFAWASGRTEPAGLEDSVANGIVLIKGSMYTKGPQDDRSYTVCQAEQLDEDYLPPDQQRVMNCFNVIAERLDAIERRLANLENPQPLDKPVLRPPAPKPAEGP
jgi:hypothetical protein